MATDEGESRMGEGGYLQGSTSIIFVVVMVRILMVILFLFAHQPLPFDNHLESVGDVWDSSVN